MAKINTKRNNKKKNFLIILQMNVTFLYCTSHDINERARK